MDEHRIDPNSLEKDNVSEETLDNVFVVHRRAAIFNNKKMAAEFLDERKRLNEEFQTV
jgi:hypothetical protein